jgi:hypothetical protein
MNEPLAVVIVVVAALLLRVAIRAIMVRLAVVPADELLRSHGFKDVLIKLRDRIPRK